jgi:hypothetical protein
MAGAGEEGSVGLIPWSEAWVVVHYPTNQPLMIAPDEASARMFMAMHRDQGSLILETLGYWLHEQIANRRRNDLNSLKRSFEDVVRRLETQL